MTAYHGGKHKHGKKIAEIINTIYNHFQNNISGYIEPFCGMCGVYRHVVQLLPKTLNYIASDNHKSLILMWKALQNGWIPPKDCSIKRYNELKQICEPSPERGYIGFTFGYGGQFFCGPHRRVYGIKHCDNSNNIHNIAQTMNHVKFINKDYSYYTLSGGVKNNIIYCDPPYSDKKISKYYNDNLTLQSFDSDKFWEWCRQMSKYNLVLITEYSAPTDFISIYKFNSERFRNKNPNTKIESIYIYDKYLINSDINLFNF